MASQIPKIINYPILIKKSWLKIITRKKNHCYAHLFQNRNKFKNEEDNVINKVASEDNSNASAKCVKHYEKWCVIVCDSKTKDENLSFYKAPVEIKLPIMNMFEFLRNFYVKKQEIKH